MVSRNFVESSRQDAAIDRMVFGTPNHEAADCLSSWKKGAMQDIRPMKYVLCTIGSSGAF
jgi:hypothetical protein